MPGASFLLKKRDPAKLPDASANRKRSGAWTNRRKTAHRSLLPSPLGEGQGGGTRRIKKIGRLYQRRWPPSQPSPRGKGRERPFSQGKEKESYLPQHSVTVLLGSLPVNPRTPAWVMVKSPHASPVLAPWRVAVSV